MISGILNINKPPGITSHDVVARIRKLSGQRKVGHTGTLDPMATGVLVVCLGQATRLIEYLQPGHKTYRAIIRFGITTDTLDAEGRVTRQTDPAHLTAQHLRQILPRFQGTIQQLPPIYSAIKQGGKPLYKRARAGETVTVEPRTITIEALHWLQWQPPDLTLDIVCSTGTYIRSVARDLGEAAGVGAHLIELTRTANGPWPLTEAITLSELEKCEEQGAWQKHLYPLDAGISHLPKVVLTTEGTGRVQYGQRLELTEVGSTVNLVRAYTSDSKFLAILTRDATDDKLWQPKKVFHREDD